MSILTTANRVLGQKQAMAQNEMLVRQAGFGQLLDDGPPSFQIGAGRRYPRRYNRYRVGQTDVAPSGNGNYPSGCGVPHGRTVQECPPVPRRCDCHIIGANTLGSTGAASGAFDVLTVDSGDACSFDPFYIAMFAIERNDDDTVANSTVILGLLTDSKSGQDPNMRNGSGTDSSVGVATLIYGDQKEIECVDWLPFSSTGQQQLFLTFFMPVTGLGNGAHFFVILWGTPYA